MIMFRTLGVVGGLVIVGASWYALQSSGTFAEAPATIAQHFAQPSPATSGTGAVEDPVEFPVPNGP